MKFSKKRNILALTLAGVFMFSSISNAETQMEVNLKKSDTPYINIYGADRYETSGKVTEYAFDRSENVIIVDGESYIDGISAGILSKRFNAPIILNKGNILNNETLSKISGLYPDNIYVVGIEKKPLIEQSLKSRGYNVESITGRNPFELSFNTANFNKKKKEIDGNKSLNKVVIASKNNFPDGISISSYASCNEYPIILVDKDISDDEALKINSIAKDGVIIVGGENSISRNSEKKLNAPERVSGKDRYETSRIIYDRFFKGKENAIVALGGNYADTISSIPIAIKSNNGIILVKKYAEEAFFAHVKSIIAVGGNIERYSSDVVYIVPHQDDETIDMGLDIIRDVKAGRKVYAILMTDGSKSHAFYTLDNILKKNNKSLISKDDFVYARNKEMLDALEKMGVKKENILINNFENLELKKEDVLKKINEFESIYGKNFSYKTLAKNEFDKSRGNSDHFACKDAVEEFCRNNNRNATYFSSRPDKDDNNLYVNYPNDEEALIWDGALKMYGENNHQNGNYGVGFRSVRSIFNGKINNLVEFSCYE